MAQDAMAIAAATNATLTLANVNVADSGEYDVTVTNVAGSATSEAATLVVSARPRLTSACFSNDVPQIAIEGTLGDVYVIEGSTNLIDWTPFMVVTNEQGRFVLRPDAGVPRSFYRARLTE